MWITLYKDFFDFDYIQISLNFEMCLVLFVCNIWCELYLEANGLLLNIKIIKKNIEKAGLKNIKDSRNLY